MNNELQLTNFSGALAKDWLPQYKGYLVGVQDTKTLKKHERDLQSLVKAIEAEDATNKEAADIARAACIWTAHQGGILLKELKDDGKLSKGAAQTRSHDGTTLKQLGLNKNLSSRWQAVATLSPSEINGVIERGKEGKEVTVAAAINAGKDKQRRKERRTREEKLKQHLETKGAAPDKTTIPAEVIVADPNWKYDCQRTPNRAVENHYPTAGVDEICDEIEQVLVADDCILFLWATAPKLLEALQVMGAWGFTYITQTIWDKEKIGMGFWVRGQHEIILIGRKGTPRLPEHKDLHSSVFRETRGKIQTSS